MVVDIIHIGADLETKVGGVDVIINPSLAGAGYSMGTLSETVTRIPLYESDDAKSLGSLIEGAQNVPLANALVQIAKHLILKEGRDWEYSLSVTSITPGMEEDVPTISVTVNGYKKPLV